MDIGPGAKEQEIHTDDGLIQLPRPRPLIGIVCFVPLRGLKMYANNGWIGHDGLLG